VLGAGFYLSLAILLRGILVAFSNSCIREQFDVHGSYSKQIDQEWLTVVGRDTG